MATDLKSPAKTDLLLQQKFAALCARTRNVDLISALLLLALTPTTYALLLGIFDLCVGNSDAAWVPIFRWGSYAGFVLLTLFLTARTVRCAFRRINPYYVAQQLERTLPDAKNSLINWLDLHEEDLPTVFRKNLTANAALQFEESDPEQTLRTRKNRFLLGALAFPVLGLLVLLLLGPLFFASSMMRAFVPFIETPFASRTHITLLQPQEGNAEVNPAQAVAFAVKIEGHVPANHRDDAPKLLYRYQEDEDYLTQRLQSDGNGVWTAQLLAAQVRNGFFYKITAGDAATPDYRIRVRARLHVKQFALTYLYRPYRNLPKITYTFPNESSAVPVIHGPRGTEIELVVHASRPVRKAAVEIVTKKAKIEVAGQKLPKDPQAFACRWTLEEPAKFRVVFTSTDGEENADRDLYEISVFADEVPLVVITQPGKDAEVAENGTLPIVGRASNDFGLKAMSLHVRVASGTERPKLQAKIYREGKSFQFADGTYPNAIEYQDFLALDQLKSDKGTRILFPPGTILEYWLEATDSADYPRATGNIGKSSVYQIKLLPAIKNPQQQQAERKQAERQAKDHAQSQDKNFSQPRAKSSRADLEKQKEQIEKALKEENKQQQGGPDPNQTESKQGPQPNDDAPPPQKKDADPKAPDDAGKKKEQGQNKGGGESKDKGDSSKDEAKGERKDGPKESATPAKEAGGKGKEESAGGAKDGGPMGMDQPEPAPPKENAADEGAPLPLTKQGKADPSAEGNAKGADQLSKEANADGKKKEPTWDELAKLIEQLPQHDDAGQAAGKKLADFAKQAQDERKREIAKEALEKNQRDPDNGQPLDTNIKPKGNKQKGTQEKKGPNPYGSLGQSQGVSDEVKAAAANREFARRIGQMQLNDWKKRLTPELLKKAGLSQADWQRFVKEMQAYDAQVRRLNALRTKAGDLHGGSRPPTRAELKLLESTATDDGALGRGSALPPPDLLDAQRRLLKSRP